MTSWKPPMNVAPSYHPPSDAWFRHACRKNLHDPAAAGGSMSPSQRGVPEKKCSFQPICHSWQILKNICGCSIDLCLILKKGVQLFYASWDCYSFIQSANTWSFNQRNWRCTQNLGALTWYPLAYQSTGAYPSTIAIVIEYLYISIESVCAYGDIKI